MFYTHVAISIYVYIFWYFSFDATRQEDRLRRYVNDSPEPNCKMKFIVCNGLPKLCLFAINNICKYEELVYDYGAPNLWWRSDVSALFIPIYIYIYIYLSIYICIIYICISISISIYLSIYLYTNFECILY